MRWLSLAVLAVLITGCYSPPLTDGLPCTRDTHRCPSGEQCDPHTSTCVSQLEPRCMAYGKWGTPTPLAFPMAMQAALSPDGGMLVFATNVANHGGDLYLATWDASTNDFVDPRALDMLNTTSDDVYPSWSADGTSLYYFSDGNLLRSTVSAGPTFVPSGAAVELAALGARAHLRFTWDDLDLFYWDSTLKLRHAHRTTADATAMWQDASNDLAMLDDATADERDPAIDAEALRIVYSLDDNRLLEASRADRSAPFADSQVIESLGSANFFEPELSRDGLTLLFTTTLSGDDRIYMATRTCVAR